jgi:hypothetical protein
VIEKGASLIQSGFKMKELTTEVSLKSVTGVLVLICENENPTSIERESLLNVI